MKTSTQLTKEEEDQYELVKIVVLSIFTIIILVTIVSRIESNRK